MNRARSEYAEGTWLESEEPYDGQRRARAIFPDGVARIVRLAMAADTYFSVPARDGKGNRGVVSLKSEIDEAHPGALMFYVHRGPMRPLQELENENEQARRRADPVILKADSSGGYEP